MDDLAGLAWNSSSSSSKPPPPLKPTSPAPFNARPSPLSSRTVSPANATTKPPPAGDSFSNLVSFGRSKANDSNITLRERQKLLQEQRAKEEEERRKKMDSLFGDGGGGANAGFWDSLETGRVSPMPVKKIDDDEEDLLAAFSATAPVDNSSYYPPPIGSGVSTPLQSVEPTPVVMVESANSGIGSRNDINDIMDPFDLDNLPSRDPSPFNQQHSSSNAFGDDDILGDLGKPVEALPPKPSPRMEEPPFPLPGNDPRDPAIAEIVDMGFTVEQAKKALVETDTGLDVTAAVGWLLEDAHRKSRPASANPPGSRSGSRAGQEGCVDPPRRRRDDSGQPAWMRDGSCETQEKDIGQMASQIGGTLFKSANSLWNTGKKRVGKAIAELQDGNTNDGGDPNIPKWMRDAQQHQLETAVSSEKWDRGNFAEEDMRPARPAQREKAPEPLLTEEALMLEAGSGPLPRRRQEKEKPSRVLSEKEQIQLQRQQAFEAAIRQKEQEMRERERPRQTPSPAASIPNSSDRRAKLARGAAEEDSAVQYVSKNRRRPPPPSSSSTGSISKPATPEPPMGDLLFGGSRAPREPSRNPFLQQQQQQQQRLTPSPASRCPTPSTTTPIVTRPTPNRPVVPISQQVLQTSSVSRQKGTDSFRRGDYPTALAHYTSALNQIPPLHPIRIIILSNRALCNLKIGDSRAVLADCDEALGIIGPSNGESETITLEDGTKKDMKELFGKTLTRKAEGYEHMEKWAEALKTWTQAVEASAGGAIAISGKRRCEAALQPKPAPKPKPTAPAPPTARRAPPRSSQSTSGGRGEAARVTALRQANAAADKVEEEKLALHDRVEDRVNAWKSGKEGNLRALLASLDTVLWEGNGWKKVGMGELLMPNKCKIAYMKGIGKVHPDKISLEASTEQKMISAAVFTLLNEAWDKFKAENGL
ncbi:unnamed protein product [Tuber aestivum]|uniref:UBA domain-containing protein n=1 Tax=Tuber aestivum TaxID=59557 RepID=A0A292PIY9_9PEZI|nr:unnamed protein product [Tuber aestivum]